MKSKKKNNKARKKKRTKSRMKRTKKNMKKQLVIVGILTLLVSVVLSGCNSTEQIPDVTPEELIIGQWYNDTYNMVLNYTFYENHSSCLTLGIKSFWMGYEITEDNIIMKNLTDGSSTFYEYFFTNNNQKLSITSSEGEVIILTRR